MLNKYPLWKNLLIIFALVVSAIFAIPNLYPDDYAIQVSGASTTTAIDDRLLARAERVLKKANIDALGAEVGAKNLLIRVNSSDDQLKAKAVMSKALGDDYLTALNLAPTTPDWLSNC